MSTSPEDTGSDQVALFLAQLRELARGLVERTLGVERSFESLAAMIEGAGNMADIAADRLEKVLPARHYLDCGKGCSHCCRQPLIATDPARVLYLAHYIETHADERERAVWKDALALGQRRPCVLLDGDLCLAYAVRPEGCRAYNAFDSSACAAGDLAVMQGEIGDRAYPVLFAIAAALAGGLAEGLEALGLEYQQVELNAALRTVQARPDAVAAWLAGEPVFAKAHLKV